MCEGETLDTHQTASSLRFDRHLAGKKKIQLPQRQNKTRRQEENFQFIRRQKKKKRYTEWEAAANGRVSISEKIALLFYRWEAIHQLCRSLDFRARGWRDLVNHETADWFSSLYLKNLAQGRWKFPSLSTLIECNFVFTQRAHLPPVFYFPRVDAREHEIRLRDAREKKKTNCIENSAVWTRERGVSPW